MKKGLASEGKSLIFEVTLIRILSAKLVGQYLIIIIKTIESKYNIFFI